VKFVRDAEAVLEPNPSLSDHRSALAELAVKVPEITVYFWVIKILSTAMGEALSDFLDGGSGIIFPVLGCLSALVAFVLALRWQLRSTRYRTHIYWFAVAMVATFGTMAADAFHQALSMPYWGTSLIYVTALGVILSRWYASEGTLSIHSITTRRRERFYWATVLATFALGTAVGDMTADDFHWGFLVSALVFSGAIVLPLLAWWKFRLNSIVAFWTAYILTRPLGASYADWLDFGKARDGIGVGTAITSSVLAAVIIAIVAYLAMSGKDEQLRSAESSRARQRAAHVGEALRHRGLDQIGVAAAD
jgi:uncharacterized membrane-anchored protein